MRLKSVGNVVSTALACLVVIGCTDDDGAKCGAGTELIAGECLPVSDAGATEDASAPVDIDAAIASCGEHTVVIDGVCRGLQPVGGSCSRGNECETGTCLPNDDGFPGGYCSIPSCNDLRPCPTGAYCQFSVAKEVSVCLAFCSGKSECRDDYVCQPIYGSALGVCSPKCQGADNNCPDQTYCDEDSGKCILRECDPKAAESNCGENRVCYPDPRKLTTQGGLCLSTCNPGDSKCQAGDVCQPLPADPANTGICAPPVCKETSDCSVGAICKDTVCQPPARCDDQGACADENTACVGGAGGQCMPKCPTDKSCSDIHSGLVCANSVAAAPVCLPVGSFPGSACRADKNSACDSIKVGTNSAPMTCVNDTCVVECGTGGNALCQGVSSTLSCATGVFEDAVCLPKGSYPGSSCTTTCADVNIKEGVSAKMLCKSNTCVFDCSSAAIGTANAEQYCAGIETSLSCTNAIYPGSSVCLPAGSYPGGPCSHGMCGKLGNTQMACEDNKCLLTCTPNDPTTADTNEDACGLTDPSRVCAHGIYSADVCLPKGAFPGSPCGGANHDQCAQDLNGVAELDMQCVNGACVIGCSESGKYAGYGEALCGFADPSLTCAQAAGSICVKGCVSGACDTGYSCLIPGTAPAQENACLPNGTFLGSKCATGNMCYPTQTQPLVCVPSGTPACGWSCASQFQGGGQGPANTYCTGVGTQLGTGFDTCQDVGGGLRICINAP